MDDCKRVPGADDRPRFRAYRIRRALFAVVTIALGVLASLNSVEMGVVVSLLKRVL